MEEEEEELFGYWKWTDEKHRLFFVGTLKLKKKKPAGGVIIKRKKPVLRAKEKFKEKKLKPVRPPVKRTLHSSVTVDDIKWISLDELFEVISIPKVFYKLFLSEQFDNFLEAVIIYFYFFFDKMAKKERPSPMFVEPSLAERTALAESIAKINIALHRLAKAYCYLVLGLELKELHHLECGQGRSSKFLSDKMLFESLFLYCTIAVWIAFKRKHLDIIQDEFNRLMRTEAFSPKEPIWEEVTDKPDTPSVLKIEDILKRVSHPLRFIDPKRKRLPLKAYLDNRSRVMASLFPDPKFEATLAKMQPVLKKRDKDTIEQVKVDSQLEKSIEDMSLSDSDILVGIIGLPFSAFNPLTLAPIFADRIEEEDEDKKVENVEDSAKAVIEAMKAETKETYMADDNDIY